MFLSKVQFEPSKQLWGATAYTYHQFVMSAFPSGLTDERILFYLNDKTLLVQSPIAPDWAKARPYLIARHEHRTFAPQVGVGQALRFRLLANPTSRDSQTGKRFGLRTDEDLLPWIQRKGRQHGFSVAQVTINGAQRETAYKGALPITVSKVQFDGCLMVTNPDLFLQAIQSGIGSGKGLGCGMLMLAAS